MTQVSVVVPWRDGGCEFRRAAMQRVVGHLSAVFPDSDLALVDDGDELWSRGASIDLGVAQASHDVIVVADADLIVPHAQLWAAAAAADESPGQVIPFTSYRYLSEAATAAAIAHPSEPIEVWRELWTMDTSVGGSCAFSRETWELACGHDPRFRGWGWQDIAFRAAASTFAGPLRRIDGDAAHLYHPIDATNNDESPTLAANTELGQRYAAAIGDADAMRAIVSER